MSEASGDGFDFHADEAMPHALPRLSKLLGG
jgi:hypothetical protein